MKVICAGWGRTGTRSLKYALEHINKQPSYHMQNILLNKQDAKKWHNLIFDNTKKNGITLGLIVKLFCHILVNNPDLNPWETIALENLSIESGASYAEIPSINGKKNIIFGSKNLINEATEIFGGDWKIK